MWSQKVWALPCSESNLKLAARSRVAMNTKCLQVKFGDIYIDAVYRKVLKCTYHRENLVMTTYKQLMIDGICCNIYNLLHWSWSTFDNKLSRRICLAFISELLTGCWCRLIDKTLTTTVAIGFAASMVVYAKPCVYRLYCVYMHVHAQFLFSGCKILVGSERWTLRCSFMR